LKEHQKLSWS